MASSRRAKAFDLLFVEVGKVGDDFVVIVG